jgi:hypothetical protein
MASTAATVAARAAAERTSAGATNLDAIAEVNVQMSAYAAEYGLKGGAQVNFITIVVGSNKAGSTARVTARSAKARSKTSSSRDHEPARAAVPRPATFYGFKNSAGDKARRVNRARRIAPLK